MVEETCGRSDHVGLEMPPGLRYVNDVLTMRTGIRRGWRGRGKRYIDANGLAISHREVIQRITSLAIPPAWRDVWICPDPLGQSAASDRGPLRRPWT